MIYSVKKGNKSFRLLLLCCRGTYFPVEKPLLCNHCCNDFFVTFSLWGFTSEVSNSIDESEVVFSCLGPRRRTSSPSSSCSSLITASLTSELLFIFSLLTPNMIKMSSWTESPAIPVKFSYEYDINLVLILYTQRRRSCQVPLSI